MPPATRADHSPIGKGVMETVGVTEGASETAEVIEVLIVGVIEIVGVVEGMMVIVGVTGELHEIVMLIEAVAEGVGDAVTVSEDVTVGVPPVTDAVIVRVVVGVPENVGVVETVWVMEKVPVDVPVWLIVAVTVWAMVGMGAHTSTANRRARRGVFCWTSDGDARVQRSGRQRLTNHSNDMTGMVSAELRRPRRVWQAETVRNLRIVVTKAEGGKLPLHGWDGRVDHQSGTQK